MRVVGPSMRPGRGFAPHATPAREGKATGFGVRPDRGGAGGIGAPSPCGHVLPPRVRHGRSSWPGPSRFPWRLFGFSSRVDLSGPATTSAHLMSPSAKGPLVRSTRSTCLSRARSGDKPSGHQTAASVRVSFSYPFSHPIFRLGFTTFSIWYCVCEVFTSLEF